MSKQEVYSRIAGIRRGFEYQDAQAIDLFVRWLMNPQLYRWVKLEADEYGYLDDIVACRNDETIECIQVKYALHPDDPKTNWTWEDLIEPKENKPPLLKKWFDSWKTIKKFHENVEVIIVTNKSPTGSLCSTIGHSSEGYFKVNLERLKNDKELFSKLSKIAESKEELEKFLKDLRFNFDRDLETLWEHNYYKFVNRLGGTEGGWNSLKKATREWTLKRNEPPPDGKIYFHHVKKAALWFEPKPLNQNFPVPKDFVLFDPDLFKKIVSNLSKPEGGILIFHGTAGVGKSTFLSFLYQELKKKDLPVIRHHYYISLTEESYYERLKKDRAIESIKNQFYGNQVFKESLGELANKNPGEVKIRELLEVSSRFFTTKNKSLIVIIDGLDHVLREDDKKELIEFLKEFLPLPSNVWLILGTQTQVLSMLPNLIWEKCPEKHKIEIKGLPLEGVAKILEYNKNRLKFREDFFGEIVSKLYDISKGHPLYLRYCINWLSQKDSEIFPRLLDNLPPFNEDINNYYIELWKNLSDEAKKIAILLATIDFGISDKQIIEILNDGNEGKLIKGFKEIQHLLVNKRNKIYIFHHSFKVFLLDTDEYKLLERKIKEKILLWLKQKAPEYLRWAYEGIMECELGNPEFLLKKLDREWIEQAIKDCRPYDLIGKQLRIATFYAFKEEKYSKGLELGLLLNYFQRVPDEHSEAWNKVWVLLQQKRPNQTVELEEINSLSLPQLAYIAKEARDLGDEELLEKIRESLNLRLISANLDDEYLFKFTGKIVGYLSPNVDYSKFLEWVSQLNEKLKLTLLENLIITLAETHQETILRKILLNPIIENHEKKYLLDILAKYFLKTFSFKEWIINEIPIELRGSWIWVYAFIHDNIRHLNNFHLHIPYPEEFPHEVDEFSDKRYIFAEKYFEVFVFSLLNSLLRNKDIVTDLFNKCDDRWSHLAYKKVVILAEELVKSVEAKQPFYYGTILNVFADLPIPKWPKDRKLIELYNALKLALRNIILVIWLITKIKIRKETILNFKDSLLFNFSEWLTLIQTEKVPILEEEAYHCLLNTLEEEYDNAVTYFSERSSSYANLAEVASLYGDKEAFDRLIDKTIKNFITYGSHKDVFLFLVLDSIKACHNAGSKKTKDWLKSLVPFITEVTNYTDGDETDHLPTELSKTLSEISPELLKSYYLFTADNEDLFLAEDIFPDLIKTLNLSNPVAQAIAQTAIDKESIQVLKNIAERGNEYAHKILSENENYFGILSHLEKEYNSSTYSKPSTKKTSYKVENISPSELANYFESIDSLERESFLIDWIKHWLKPIETREEAYKAIKAIFHKYPHMLRYYEILELIIPYAQEFEPPNRVFELICEANIYGYGWNKWLTVPKHTYKRWETLKKFFPEKWKEFIFKTIGRTPYDNEPNFNYFMPIPRLVEYFIYFDDLNTAEMLTETLVKFTESLMGNLHLEEPEWISASEPDLYEILFSRLLWPSPIVRERAASAIAELLLHEKYGEETLQKLCNWLENQKLETTIILGLLPFLKAIRKNKNKLKDKLLSILSAIKAPSLLAFTLIKEIQNELKCDIEVSFEKLSIPKELEQCPLDHTPDEFFTKFIKGFIPPVYWDNADFLEKEYGINFIQQWSWEFEKLIRNLNIPKKHETVMYYHGMEPQPSLVGLSSKISEVYKSSFLRTLALFDKENKIPDWAYFGYAYQMCPMDVSLWEILPQRPPEWWPRFSQSPQDQQIDTVSPQAITLIEELVNSMCFSKDSAEIILAVRGPIQPVEGWVQNKLFVEFSILGFAYKTLEPHLPMDEEIANYVLWKSFWIPNPYTQKPFTFFDNPHDAHFEPKELQWELDGMLIVPLVSRLKTLTINLWQWFKEFPTGGIFGLSKPLIGNSAKFVTEKNKWKYISFDGKSISEGYWWLMGIIERKDNERPIPTGQILTVDRDWLLSFLEENKLRLGFIIEVKFLSKEHSYEKPRVNKIYKTFGLSPLIIS